MKTKYFLKNKLPSILCTRDGTLDIPGYGYAQIREQDCENLTILYATERDWAEIVNEEPTDTAPSLEKIKIEITEPYKGMTLEELQVEQAAKAKEKAKAEVKEETPTEAPVEAEAEVPAPKTKKATK